MDERMGDTSTKDPSDLKNARNSEQNRSSFELFSENSDSKSKDNKTQLDSPSSTKIEKRNNESPDRSSPEPSCAICLGQLQNKSFTNSCLHTFCFSCLVEWSKVKAECPLCKQQFQSIIHNVRSFKDFDRYIVSRGPEVSWNSVTSPRRFRYHTTLTPERAHIQRAVAFHRLLFAPHTVNLPSSSSDNVDPEFPVVSTFRRRVYNEELWVKKPQIANRYRCATPEFFRDNPACRHRLAAWLNRELQALLQDSNTRIMFILDLILGLITHYHIQSEEFFVHMEPYLGSRTSHFVHEFFNFASSPYEMREYDENVTYERYPAQDSSTVLSSPGSDIIPLSSTGSVWDVPPRVVEPPRIRAPLPRKKRSDTLSQLLVKQNNNSDLWDAYPQNSVSTWNFLGNTIEISTSFRDSRTGLAGPSTSNNVSSSNNAPIDLSVVECHVIDSDSSVHSDECKVVEVKKPRHERTPEIIDLISDSDNEAAPTARGTSENLSMHLQEPTSSLQTTEIDNASHSSVSNVVKRRKKSSRHATQDGRDNSRSPSPMPFRRKSKNSSQRSLTSSESDDGKIWRPMSPSRKSNSPSSYLKRGTTTPPHSRYSESTDISDYGSSKEDHGSSMKLPKLKLRSVIRSTQSGYQNSGSESSRSHRSSSHSLHSKRHKDKKKKKKRDKHYKHKCYKHSSKNRD